MGAGQFVTEAIGDSHRLTSFDCGKPELDMWLRDSARHAENHRTARTFVWHAGDGVVVAYYSLAGHLIEREELSQRLARGNPARIPAILLARLALDKRLQGGGLGGVLLFDALSRAAAASRNVTCRFVVVDALDKDAAGFYLAHGFHPVPGDPHRLVRKMSDIEADLAAR